MVKALAEELKPTVAHCQLLHTSYAMLHPRLVWGKYGTYTTDKARLWPRLSMLGHGLDLQARVFGPYA